MAYTGIEPEGVRVLADRLTASADLADDLAVDIARALFDSGLASSTPVVMQGLADGLAHTSAVLRSRSDLAQGLVLDFALHSALLSVAKSVVISSPPCVLGPSTAIGFASPCDPVESIKVYSLAGAAFVPIAALAGVKLDAAYILRVEYLRSGRLRVTRIDEAALGVAWSAGIDSEVNVGKLTTTSGASAKAWVQLLLAQGTTYEIAESDLDEFIVSDILDHVDRPFALPGGISGFGLVKNITKKIVGVADHLPSWKLHDVISGLRKRLNWNPPAPLSTFTEGGLSAGTTGGFGLGFMGQAPLNGKAGITISGRAVVGWEQRAGEQIFYLDVRSEIGTPLSYRLFGIDLSKLAAAETKIGVARNNETGDFDRLEFTIITENGKNIERRTAVLELTDPTTQPAAQRLIDDLTDPTRLPDSIDAVEKLLGHWVTTERTTLRRMDKSSYGIEVFGTGVKFTVDELDVR